LSTTHCQQQWQVGWACNIAVLLLFELLFDCICSKFVLLSVCSHLQVSTKTMWRLDSFFCSYVSQKMQLQQLQQNCRVVMTVCGNTINALHGTCWIPL
jgi:hypothetical protein